jgi:hypothetical protein
MAAVSIAHGKAFDFGPGDSLAFTRPFCEPHGCSEQGGRGGSEPLSAWHKFSGEANAILMLAALLHANDGPVRVPPQLARLVYYGACDAEEDSASIEYVDWRWVQAGLERWLGFGNVRPSLLLDNGGPTICLGSANSLVREDVYLNASRTGFFFASHCGLFGALATQLLLACQNRGGFAYCVECQTYFEPRRKPRAGERAFCDECRHKRSKYAARDFRKRKREACSSPL